MTVKSIKKWKMLHVITRREVIEIVICASPKATNIDLIAFARAYVPSRALQEPWTVIRMGKTPTTRCRLTRGFLHYTLTIPRKETRV